MKLLRPIFYAIIVLGSLSVAISDASHTSSWIYYGIATLATGYFLKSLFSCFINSTEDKLKKTGNHVVLYFQRHKVGSIHDVIMFLKEHNCLYDDDLAIKTISDTLRYMRTQGIIQPLTDEINNEINENTVWLSTFEGAEIQKQIINI